ncbi:MAG: sigma factor-like helix-turn-helix DNA-binding protein [Patescibacteria group bacterium]
MIKNIDQLINDLFASFNSRQVRVINGRFGLKTGEKTTLQEIGDELEITRERVRQIEEQIIKKLVPKIQERVGEFLEFSNKHLLDLGGVRKDDNFIDDLEYFLKPDETIKHFGNKIRFLFFVAGTPFYSKEDDDLHGFWYYDENAKSNFLNFLEGFKKIFQTNDKENVLKNKIHLKYCKDLTHCHFVSIPKYFGTNVFGDFGLKEWPEIRPRGVRDKIYLVLKKHGKPLHFQDIAKYVNRFGIDKKPVHVQTSHNELINDDRFVLVGRGIYGLREYGFEPGTVKEVIIQLLKKRGPLTAPEILKLMSQERFFRANTVLLNLQNRSFFKKTKDGRYHCVR